MQESVNLANLGLLEFRLVREVGAGHTQPVIDDHANVQFLRQPLVHRPHHDIQGGAGGKRLSKFNTPGSDD
jgi:hypothetical protein